MLILLKCDRGNFIRAYEFLSQMFDYGNTDYEKLYVFARLPLLDYGREREGIDLSALRLTHHKMRNLGQQKLNLDNGAGAPPTPMTEAGSGQVQDKRKIRLQELIEALNDLFEGDITDGDKVSHVDSVIKPKMIKSAALQAQAKANTKSSLPIRQTCMRSCWALSWMQWRRTPR